MGRSNTPEWGTCCLQNSFSLYHCIWSFGTRISFSSMSYSVHRRFSKDNFDPASDISMVVSLEWVERASIKLVKASLILTFTKGCRCSCCDLCLPWTYNVEYLYFSEIVHGSLYKSLIIKKLNIIDRELSDGYVVHFPLWFRVSTFMTFTTIPSKPLANFLNPQPFLMLSLDSLRQDSSQAVLQAVSGISLVLAYRMKSICNSNSRDS